MRRQGIGQTTAVRLALALLQHAGGGGSGETYREALSGDLLEELERTRDVGRFWRAVLVEVMRGAWERWLQPAAFSAGWSLCYPAWRAMEGGRVWPALAERSAAMEFPYSSVALLASAGLSPVLFVWCGALVYIVRNQLLVRNQMLVRNQLPGRNQLTAHNQGQVRDHALAGNARMAGDRGSGGWAGILFRTVRGLSLGLSVLLVAAMVMLSERGRADEGLGHGDGVMATLAQRMPDPAMTLSLTLSLLAATISARPPRMQVR